ncbi:DDE superfamily endonuclease [Streptomyces sp. cf386]|nr:DDE superfamily endonuclease [Streptomyces sp. cf386]
MLAHLRLGHTYTQLAAGFEVGVSTAYRYITEAIDLLAVQASNLATAVTAASAKAFAILDGTLLPIDRMAANRPLCSGKHKKHGMNVQVMADPYGKLLWASHRGGPGLLGGQGATRARAGTVRVPFRGRRDRLSAGQRAVNTAHARIRALAEQAMAALKTWRLLRKLRCSTTLITSHVQAVLTLHLTCAN